MYRLVSENILKIKVGEDSKMPRKLIFFLLVIFVLSLFIGQAEAQLKTIYKFKGVMVPLKMELDDSVIKKGRYDIEFLKNQAAGSYIMRILRGRKKLCTLTGEELTYDSRGGRQLTDPNIPDDPRLRMRKNAAEKQIHFIFESGRKSPVYPYVYLRFKIGYLDE